MTGHGTTTAAATGELGIRRASEADHAAIAAIVDAWFGGRRVRHLVPRAWFRHFGSTSWLASDPGGRPIGFLIGYRSQDRPGEAVVHLVGVHPNRRRHGVGTALLRAFVEDVQPHGASAITALAWPDDPGAIAFFRAAGFTPEGGPGSRNLYGVTAFPDYDGDGEDRVVFVRRLRAG